MQAGSQDASGASAAAVGGAPPPDKSLARWQARLLPLMQWTLVGLTLFFFATSTIQLLYLQRRIGQAPAIDVALLLPAAAADAAAGPQQAEILRLRAAIRLEANTLERRHHHAAVALMAQLWIRYLGVVTGMILAIVGAVFILGKLQERFSEVSASVGGAEGSLKSSSPGLVLVVLGSALVLATLLDRRDLSVIDQPVYLGSVPLTSGEVPALPELPARDPKAP